MYILLLLAAAVVLAFALESVAFFRDAMRTPISAAADQRWWPKPDRRIFRRLAAAGAAAFLLVAGIMAMEFVHPGWGLTSAGRNLTHPYALLLYGIVFCLVALLCGVKPSQPVLLLSLTLPQLIVLPLVLLVGASIDGNILLAVLLLPFVLFIQPASWILLPIGIGQSRLLNKAGSNFTFGGLVRLCLILVAYLFGTIH